jgi:predicted dehydrogenase
MTDPTVPRPDRRPLRIGVLGAAKISPRALLVPAIETPGVEVVAIAARDRARAEAQAREFSIARVHDTYDDVLADPDVDAIYNPLPINQHLRWGLAALAAGKHLLQEKPLTSNAEEARRLVDAAEAADLVMMEAFHWRYHPMAARIRSLLDAAVIGEIRHVSAAFDVPIDPADDVRQSWELSGGALMDLGCYPVQWVRFAVGAEPRVVAARMTEGRPPVDLITEIDLAWDSGVTGSVHTAMNLGVPFAAWLEVIGTAGTLRATNPLAPHSGNRIRVDAGDRQIDEEVEGSTTYHHQIEAFRDAVVDGAPFPTGGADSIANMELIDAAYRAAGLPPRGVGPD